jgi:hypothetical protein
MRLLAAAAFEGLLRHLLARAGLPLRLLGSALFVFGVGALFVVMGLVTVLVAFDAPAPAAVPLTFAIGGLTLAFGVASALTGIGVLLGGRAGRTGSG